MINFVTSKCSSSIFDENGTSELNRNTEGEKGEGEMETSGGPNDRGAVAPLHLSAGFPDQDPRLCPRPPNFHLTGPSPAPNPPAGDGAKLPRQHSWERLLPLPGRPSANFSSAKPLLIPQNSA